MTTIHVLYAIGIAVSTIGLAVSAFSAWAAWSAAKASKRIVHETNLNTYMSFRPYLYAFHRFKDGYREIRIANDSSGATIICNF